MEREIMQTAAVANGGGRRRIVSLVEFSDLYGISLRALMIAIKRGHWTAKNGLTESGDMDLDIFQQRYAGGGRKRR